MKIKQLLLLSALAAGVLAWNQALLAQTTNAILSLQLYAGLIISGQVGDTYTIQYATSLTPSSTNWTTLTSLVLPSSPYLYIDTSAPASAQRFYRAVTTTQTPPPPGTVLVAAGSFQMGDDIDGEADAPVQTVDVSPFYMDTNLVSYAVWEPVYQWGESNGFSFDSDATTLGSNYPAQTVDWYDAARWCNARSLMAKLPPVYYTDAALTQVFTNGDVPVYANWTNAGYRLPTEAEWEKAARAGLVGDRFPWGNTISESQANYYGDPLSGSFGYGYDLGPVGPNAEFDQGSFLNGYSSPVGYFAPNGFGLYDMAGNVFEWCWDWYGPYPGGTQTDPHGPSTGSYRVMRGGSWAHFAYECRCAYRGDEAPDFADDDIGFRTVLPRNP